MTKRKVLLIAVLFALIVMAFALTVSAASNTPVKVKVQTSVGSREITTTVGKLFTVSETNNTYIITGIKSFDNYSLTAIKEVHIPYDASGIRVSSVFSSVDKIIIDDFSKVSVASLAGFTKLSTIEVGSSATVTFENGCLPNLVETLNFTGTTSTITFASSSFEGKTSIKNVNFGAGSKYILGQNCFKNTGIENLEIKDGAAITFSGTGAFSNCASLKTVYLGNGVTNVNNSPFDGCDALEMVYITSANNIADNTFRRGSGEKAQLKVYIHTTAQVTISSSAFTNRSSLGVVVCVLSTSTTSLSNCKYELHVGIPHAYKPASTTPTCYNSYVTDCPCGKASNAYYKLYQSGKSMQVVELVAGSNPGVPHRFNGVDTMSYENGIFQNGTYTLKCSVCNESENTERVASAVAVFAGYSVSESNIKAMVVGVRYNSTSLKLYEEFVGEDINFGIVLAAKDGIGNNKPLDANGNAISKSVYKLNMESQGIYDGTVKLTLNSASVMKEFVMSAYIKIGSKVYYIQGTELLDAPSTVKYTQFI